MKRILPFLILLFSLSPILLKAQLAASQSVVVANQYVKKANEAFDKKEYSVALDHYLTVLNDQPQRIPLYWNTAEAAYKTRRYNIAGKYYEQLAKTDSAQNYALLNRQRAAVRKMSGEYDKAIELYQSYFNSTQSASINAQILADIKAEIEACEWAKTVLALQPNASVTHLGDKINSTYTDIAPIQYGKTLYYTTAHFLVGSTKAITQVYASDMKDKGKPIALNVDIDTLHTAGYALNTEGSKVYYNICHQLPTGEFRCDIYFREILPDGRYKDSVKLSNSVNIDGYTASQPIIGKNGEGGDVLYFVSDRPNGQGGLDIWYAPLDANGNAGEAKNLSSINTPQDDITPYYFASGDMLFFSTNGRKSMGGFDIYYAKRTANGEWGEVQHAGTPINSSYDDTYFTFNAPEGKSHFISNRKGADCKDGEKDCVCNDIYSHTAKADLKAETFLVTTGEPLLGTRMDLIDLATGEIVFSTVNEQGNNFNFPLELDKKYRLIASKPYHISDTLDFDTKGIWLNTTLTQKLQLQSYPKVTIYVVDAIDKKPIDGAKVDFFEAGTNKRLASEILRGHIFVKDKLDFGTSYNVFGAKDTYDSDSTIISIDKYGYSNKYEYVDTLFLKPFRGLPLTLYFDNDHPNPRNRDTVTYLTYGETFNLYNIKEPEYLAAYYKKTISVKGRKKGKKSKKTIESTEIDPISLAEANKVAAFFNDSIRFGYNKLMEFSGLLVKYLNAKQNLEIVIEGYASPLAETDYNRNLTARRISSLINHFYEYGGGALRGYILSGALRIRVEPYGETKVQGEVSDDARDRKKSVYSVAAMKERRVVIKEINRLTSNDSTLTYDIKQQLGGYWTFDDKLSFLNNRMDIESRLGSSLAIVGSKPAEMPAPYSDISSVTTPRSAQKQTHEIVMVDAYTGDILDLQGQVQVVDVSTNQVVNTAKRRGDTYKYELIAGKNYIIKSKAIGYNEISKGKFATYNLSNTEGGKTKRDTILLTPFGNLPLPLYFDNDRPEAAKNRTKTTQSYEKLYKNYIAKKEDFIQKYNALLAKEGSVPSAENEMATFFDNDVKNGFETLTGYAHIMKHYLEDGYSLDIIIEGYASPLANASYNEYLTNRRINAVLNFFNQYNGKDLSQYLKNGQLALRVRPLGESKANAGVSDDSNDPNKSIYSLDASRERRVLIKDIRITKIPK